MLQATIYAKTHRPTMKNRSTCNNFQIFTFYSSAERILGGSIESKSRQQLTYLL